jgi:hypothetical protein
MEAQEFGPGIRNSGVNIYNPSYLGSRDKRILVRGQPQQKVSKTLFERIRPLWWYIPIMAAMCKAEVGWVTV